MNVKKALCIASVASNLDNFNRSNVKILKTLGYEVTLAANFHSREDINSQEKVDAFVKEMKSQGIKVVHIDFSRSPKKIGMQIRSVRQVRELLKQRFDLIHCHSPICAAIVRMEAQKYRRKYDTKVLYTAHGFHFFKGAPLKNWIIFYPIEKWMSKYTDILLTINKQDYKRAMNNFHAVSTIYIPGIGVDIKEFEEVKIHNNEIRREIGASNSNTVLLSVGELNSNKNHEMVIRALSKLPENIIYVVAGIGRLDNYLREVAKKVGVQERVKLIGFRKDISNVYGAADIFVFPSFREGLSVSLMEAMASGLPVVCSKIRGNTDLIDEGKGGFFFNPANINTFICSLSEIMNNPEINFGKYNTEKIRAFSIENVSKKMMEIYKSII